MRQSVSAARSRPTPARSSRARGGHCVVHARGELQPVFALIPTCLAASLQDFLRRARRKITDWYGEHLLVSVDFSDQDAAFDNINTEDDRLRALARLSAA